MMATLGPSEEAEADAVADADASRDEVVIVECKKISRTEGGGEELLLPVQLLWFAALYCDVSRFVMLCWSQYSFC